MRKIAILLTSLLFTFTTTTIANADLIVPLTEAPRILIPAAGNAPGANGTYFRSDIEVVNLRDATQLVQMYWLPQGTSGSAIAPRTIELGAKQGLFSDDFVGNFMSQTGVGSIEFVGVTADGQLDPAARLQVTSRIWTPRPDGGAGTMSQTFPALALPGLPTRSKTILGLRRSSQYRVNVGISNPSQTVRHFRVFALISSSGSRQVAVFELDVQPRSIEQRAVTELTDSGIVHVTIFDLTAGEAVDWQAWASSIDNESGDAWSHVAIATPVQ